MKPIIAAALYCIVHVPVDEAHYHAAKTKFCSPVLQVAYGWYGTHTPKHGTYILFRPDGIPLYARSAP